MENMKIMRNMVSVVDEKRKSHKFPLSDKEFEKINNVSKQLGFKKPRDLMVYLCCGEKSFIEKMAENERAHFAILLNPLATAINKVEAGIDIENSKKQLIDEGKKLCRTYKL